MEIRFQTNPLDVVGRTYGPKPANRDVPAAEDEVAFENSQALRTALADTPAVRSDAVARARDLVGQPEYPPREMIQKISHLLALKWDAQAE
jgi:hypothetical protein